MNVVNAPMRFIRFFLLAATAFHLGAAFSVPCLAETIELAGPAQGTTYHIKIVPPTTGLNEPEIQREIDRILDAVDRQMSTYRADSEVSRFNRAPASAWFDVSPPTLHVVAAAQSISQKTNGALDVTVGPLVRLWHFGPRAQAKRGGAEHAFEPPSDDQIAAARERVGHDRLELRSASPALRKRVAGVEIDLSSIASGYTIDQISTQLSKRGVRSFLVELGGEVRAAGTREDGSPWRVAIERPDAGQRDLLAAVPLAHAALATAGGTYKFFDYQGRRYSHIIDPATGRPVEHTLASVTVAANTCLEADGWDTPLLVLGPQRGTQCAEEHGIAAMFITHHDEQDDVKTTTAWKKRFGELRLRKNE